MRDNNVGPGGVWCGGAGSGTVCARGGVLSGVGLCGTVCGARYGVWDAVLIASARDFALPRPCGQAPCKEVSASERA
eukprot:3431052-Rhodomonas_salina.1